MAGRPWLQKNAFTSNSFPFFANLIITPALGGSTMTATASRLLFFSLRRKATVTTRGTGGEYCIHRRRDSAPLQAVSDEYNNSVRETRNAILIIIGKLHSGFHMARRIQTNKHTCRCCETTLE